MHKNSRVKSDNDLISVSLEMRNEGGGFAASIYGAMPEGFMSGCYSRIVSLPL